MHFTFVLSSLLQFLLFLLFSAGGERALQVVAFFDITITKNVLAHSVKYLLSYVVKTPKHQIKPLPSNTYHALYIKQNMTAKTKQMQAQADVPSLRDEDL